MADAVDDAFVRGNALARDGDWEGAVGEYEQARRLLPGRSALLSYNLGTAYAQLGETGRAVFHLRRALQAQAEPSDEIVEAARRNLGILQRRAEIDATAEGAQISPPEDWWDRAVSALAAPLLGWLTLVSGWCALAFVVVRTSRARRGKNTALSGALALVLCVAFLLGALVHGVALRANHSFPRAIALEQKLEVREGPGNHRKVSFVLQGGSRVRIVDASPGWSKIRLEGGLEGWVTERSLGRLGTADSIPAPAPARAKAASAT
jgi:tetratricopeptide (TPR) repeat protein